MDAAVFTAFAAELRKQANVPVQSFFQRVGSGALRAANRVGLGKPASGLMNRVSESYMPGITHELTRAGKTFTSGQVGTMAGERALSTIGKGVVGTAVAVPALAGAGYLAGQHRAQPQGYVR